ncbi:S-adenosylmethionine-dependent methyltransferase [Aspergillus stella-maris]|uniref:S-adenosylmethionine-dependent methyltransferase n=1 Tax=Aspergillus stella-maris TaxID=1810926 RepID=UPI003CCD0F36
MSTPASLPSLQAKATLAPALNSDTARLKDTCSVCFGRRQLAAGPEEQIVLRACTGCQVVKYCDKARKTLPPRACQAKDWKFAHSRECAIYKNLQPKVLPINARALLRVVVRCGMKKNSYTAEELDVFRSLETHIREMREGDKAQFERIALTSKAVKAYSGTDFEEEVLSAFGAKLDVNSFNLTNALYDRIGLYLHPYAALLNHSCDYNAVPGFDGDELHIKAIRPIAKDEQITISYIDTTYPTRTRQKELKERYFFTCQCSKCSSINKPPEPAGDAAKDAYALLESGNAGADKTKLDAITKLLIASRLPKTQQPFVSILDEVIAAEISDSYKDAFLNSALRFSRMDPIVYPHPSHPLRAVHAWTLAKITVHISQVDPGLTIPEFIKGSGQISLDYGLLAWTLLAELHAKEDQYATVPGFRGMVKRAFAEVHGEFMRNGMDPRRMGEDIRAEWGKLGRIVNGYWGVAMGEDT